MSLLELSFNSSVKGVQAGLTELLTAGREGGLPPLICCDGITCAWMALLLMGS